jgi:cation:H+ antiporter
VIDRDMLVMLGLTLALFAMGRGSRTHSTINRPGGGLLLSCFVAYQGWGVWQAQVAGIRAGETGNEY